MSRIVEWILRAWSAVLALAAGVWVLGPYGLMVMPVWDVLLSRPFEPLTYRGPFEEILTGPVFAADLRSFSDVQAIADLGIELSRASDQNQLGVLDTYGDINLGWSVQFSTMSLTQSFTYVALQAVPLLVMAALWWSLASVLRQARKESVFTGANARRLTVAGAVISGGAVVLSVATWAFRRWLIATSQIDDRVVPPPLGVETIAWAAVAVGVVLVVLGRVWHRGVIMEKELAGLV